MCEGGLCLDEKPRLNLRNDKRIKMCLQRIDSHAHTRLQFLRGVSHAVGSEKSYSDADDDDDDTEAPDDNTQHQMMTTPVTTPVRQRPYQLTQLLTSARCLVAPRDTRIAMVPCGHQRFCESCANKVHNQGRGCPVCRTPINMLLRLY